MIVTLAVGSLIAPVAPALAAVSSLPTGDSLVDGGGVTAPSEVLPDSAQAHAKQELANAWVFAAQNGRWTAYAGLSAAYVQKYGAGALAGPDGTGDAQPARTAGAISSYPYSIVMSMAQSPQQKSYYCGPAEGYAMLKWVGPSRAVNNGASLTQTQVASPSHMATDDNHGTPWASGNFVKGLNVWRGINYYVQVHAPSGTVFKNNILFDIGQNSMPLGADTVEKLNGLHYNHHPTNQLIGHWLAVYGYNQAGAVVNFIDSSTSSFPSAAPTFVATTATFASTYLTSNGIAW